MKRAKFVYYLPPLAVIFSLLFFAGSVSFTLAQSNVKNTPPPTPKPQILVSSPTPSSTPIPTPKPTATAKVTAITIPTPAPVSTPAPSILPTANPSAENSTPAPAAKLSLELSVNGGSGFSMEVEEGSNQCDILSQALQQGKISQLNMKYDSNLNTYAVYQINGIGKENNVWWTYKVNGQSPNQGCSHIKANSGDYIEWNYMGS